MLASAFQGPSGQHPVTSVLDPGQGVLSTGRSSSVVKTVLATRTGFDVDAYWPGVELDALDVGEPAALGK